LKSANNARTGSVRRSLPGSCDSAPAASPQRPPQRRVVRSRRLAVVVADPALNRRHPSALLVRSPRSPGSGSDRNRLGRPDSARSDRHARRAVIGQLWLSVRTGHLGQGLATKAAGAVVQIVGLCRIWATCDFDNVARPGVGEKVGVVREGTLHRWDRHNMSSEPRQRRPPGPPSPTYSPGHGWRTRRAATAALLSAFPSTDENRVR